MHKVVKRFPSLTRKEKSTFNRLKVLNQIHDGEPFIVKGGVTESMLTVFANLKLITVKPAKQGYEVKVL